jgi:hypothetical protein
MSNIRVAHVTLIIDGTETDVVLRSPTPFANEQFLRLALESGVDMSTHIEPYLDPDGITASLAEMAAASREVRRTPEYKAELAELKAMQAEVDALTPDELAEARTKAAHRKAIITLERMKLSSSMLAALLTESEPLDASGRPAHIYSREKAARMMPPGDGYLKVVAAIEDLWPSAEGEATAGPGDESSTPTSGTEASSPTPA